MAEDQLLDDIKSSIMDMQDKMQSTYSNLADLIVEGKSKDNTVVIKMTATYGFEDIEFDKPAFEGGVGQFKTRLREAWTNLSENIQETTQRKTMELLQGMEIPQEIKNLELEGEDASFTGIPSDIPADRE